MLRFFSLVSFFFALLAVVSASRPRASSNNASSSKHAMKRPAVVSIIGSVLPLKSREKANRFLTAHNAVRSRFGHPPLTWDRELARYARRFAETRITNCKMVHSYGLYGENIFWGSTSRWSPEKIVGVWVDEENYYDPLTNSCTLGQVCGHYTQVVWRDTLRCGCTRVNCNGGTGVYAICVYDPPGNYVGESPFLHHTED